MAKSTWEPTCHISEGAIEEYETMLKEKKKTSRNVKKIQ